MSSSGLDPTQEMHLTIKHPLAEPQALGPRPRLPSTSPGGGRGGEGGGPATPPLPILHSHRKFNLQDKLLLLALGGEMNPNDLGEANQDAECNGRSRSSSTGEDARLEGHSASSCTAAQAYAQ